MEHDHFPQIIVAMVEVGMEGSIGVVLYLRLIDYLPTWSSNNPSNLGYKYLSRDLNPYYLRSPPFQFGLQNKASFLSAW